uniref:Putative helicase n=1 Tax=viral metagenome TaxID=1070528 RepID=A0A6M3K6N5_9ZZZZ
MYIEMVRGHVSNRPGPCVPYENLRGYIQPGVPLYRSTYLFSEPFEGSISNYMGKYSINNIILDIDHEGDFRFTREKCIAVIEMLRDLVDDRFIIYFSGSGFHIQFSATLFNFEVGERLPQIVKSTLQSIFSDWVDLSFYSKTGIYRVAHTINPKTNLYKIPISFSELLHDDIHAIATKPRTDFPFDEYELIGNGELNSLIVDHLNIEDKPTFEPFKIASCIHNLWKRGPKTGERHQTVLRLTSHFRRHGFPVDAAISAILGWIKLNDEDFTEKEVEQIITYGYNKAYLYSCTDEILSKYCSPQCIYYKDRNYDSQILDTHDLHDSFIHRVTTDFSHSSLPVSKMFNVDKDVDFMPGDLVTLFGLTGAGKTALAQNLAIGIDVHGEHKEEYKLPVLYLSLEISPWLMYRREIQILRDMTKQQVVEDYKSNKHQVVPAELSHILVRSISPNLKQLEREIYEYEPRLVIIDYIELLDVSISNDRAKIKEITRFLRRLVNKLQIIIIQLSQVSREYSRAEVLDLYAGKESGSIECDSTKVIGLWGNSKIPYKKIEFFKNTDGELAEQYVMMQKSFRMIEVDKQQYLNAFPPMLSMQGRNQ